MGAGASTPAGDVTDGLLLALAAKDGLADTAALLVQKNPALVFYASKDNNTAMHAATASGNHELLQLLLSALVACAPSNTALTARVLDAQNSQGHTALMLACQKSHEQCVRLLLQHGASAALVDSIGRTALQHAALRGSSRCIKLLLSHMLAHERAQKAAVFEVAKQRADAAFADTTGGAALQQCSSTPGVPDEPAAAASAYPTQRPGQALQHSEEHQERQLVQQQQQQRLSREQQVLQQQDLLFSYVNQPDRYGRTALHSAAWSGDVKTAHLLLSAGAALTVQAVDDCYDQDLPCNAGSTPMHIAALKNHKRMVLVLMSAYVEATRGRQTGASASGGRTSQQLQDPRAVLDAYGVSPYAIAAAHGREELQVVLNPRTLIAELVDTLPGLEVQLSQAEVQRGKQAEGGGAARGREAAGADEAVRAASPLELAMRRLEVSTRPSNGSGASSSGGNDCGSSSGSSSVGGGGGCSGGGTAPAAHGGPAGALICPLSKGVLWDPMVAADGHTYDRSAITAWLQAGNTCSPITQEPLVSTQLYPNHTLVQLAQLLMRAMPAASSTVCCSGDSSNEASSGGCM